MSYVRTSTVNNLGRRPLQASAPAFSRLGWYDGPYPVYSQPTSLRLNGEFVPPTPPARAYGFASQGVVTYRVDPRTGGYRMYRTDILPRGVFQQVAFQRPAPPAISALGVSLGDASGCQLLQVGGRAILSRTSPRRKKNCQCGGRCKPCARRLGDDSADGLPPVSANGTYVQNGHVYDIDGNDLGLATAGGGVQPTLTPDPGSTSTGNVFAPSGAPSSVTQATQLIQQGVQTVIGATRGVAPPPATSWFSQYTNIAGKLVQNGVLAAGVGALGLALMAHGRRR